MGKEHINTNEYTIEHIMPQSPILKLGNKNQAVNTKEVHENNLHTIGNLTLTGYIIQEYQNNILLINQTVKINREPQVTGITPIKISQQSN